MAIKKICQISLLCLCLFGIALSVKAQSSLGQTLQINTHFRSIIGKPTWLLIIRDVDSGQVLPYLFDIRHNDNFWVAVTFERSYRVVVSNLKFGPFAVINNFCGLENGILSGKSMYITLTGMLTPDPDSSACHVLKYSDMPFTVVDNNAF